MEKIKRAAIFLVIFLFVATNLVHAKECNDGLKPSINLSDNEELFEGHDYYRKVSGENLSYLGYVDINSTFTNFYLDKKNEDINLTPSILDFGVHKILFYAIDNSECYSSKLVTFTVYDRPKVVPLKPEEKFILMTEGQGMIFIADVRDNDNDVTTYNWYLNGEKQKGALKDKFPFVTDFNSTGTYNLTLEAIDSKNLSDSFTWIVSVKNKNRDPYISSDIPDQVMEKDKPKVLDSLRNYFGDADNETLHYVINATDENGNPLDISSFINAKDELELDTKNFTGVMILEITAKDLFGGVVKSNKFKVYIIDKNDISGYKEITSNFCGDKICAKNETCQTCPGDCGPCNAGENRCISNWVCGDWTACLPFGFKVRECKDLNNCFDNTSTKPKIASDCDMKETCFDKIKNNGEKGVDCGGPCDACPTCFDHVQNGGETGVDCGGPCNIACPTCNDSIQNQFESDIDCGGPCNECNDGLKCYSWKDCQSHVCKNGVCQSPSCFDGVKNGLEKGVDCGSACNNTCPTCFDGIQNEGETGVDCGGPCDACPTCFDGIKNQDEKYVDCGGGCRACTWKDFKIYNPSRAFTIQILILVFLLPFISLLIFEIWKKFIGKSSIEKMVVLNSVFRGKKRRFADKKQEIQGAISKIKKIQKELAEASRKNSKEDIIQIISDLLEKTMSISLTNDEDTIRQKLKEKRIGYPLNKIMMYLIRDTKDVSTNKYISGLELLNRMDKIIMALSELEKET